MSDPHGPEEATRESGGDGSAVGVEDAPTRATDDHDETDGTDASTVTHESDDEGHDERDAESSDSDDEDDSADEDDAGAARNHDDDDDDDDDDDERDTARAGSGRGGLFAAIGVAVLAVIGVLVLLAAFVWPDFTGPGNPDETANQAVSALSSKDAAALGNVGCKRTDGSQAVQLPPQILQLVQSATPTGPPRMTLSTEARQTINLTLGVPGQPPQSAPVDMVLAQNDGAWCLNNIEAGQ